MRLTSFTDYSLRVLIYLGVTENRSVTVNELAQAYGISRNHLVKIVHRLGTLGYIETKRGKNGGMRLARDAAEIHLGDVVRKFEDDMTIVECFNARTNTCSIAPACALKGILRAATGQFMAELDRHTLADVVASRRRLRPLLRIPKQSRSRGSAT